jgi:tRNA(Ile)-lysidine synthase
MAISLEMLEKAETSDSPESVYNGETGCLDGRFLSDLLEIRNWKPGDRFQPMGSAGEEKLKALFQQARIPRWERRLWPVVTVGSVIVWASRFGVAGPFAANRNSMQVLRIREVEA